MELFPRGRKSVGDTKPKGSASLSKASASKSPAAQPKAGTSATSRADNGLFGVAVVKKRVTGSAASGSAIKKTKGTSVGEAMSAAGAGVDAEDCGGLLKVVPHPSGKGKSERIEVPQFKKLAVGTLLLGLVKRVTRRQVFVALPYGLSGLVSVGEVSDFRLFADGGVEDDDMNDGEDEVEEDDIEDDDEPAVAAAASKAGQTPKGSGKSSGLEAFFVVGQALRCAVVGTSTTKHGKKSVALSLKPSSVNRGLFLEHLGPGVGVYGAVASVEDLGYVVSIGVEGVSGFLKSSDCDPRLFRGGVKRLRVGQPLDLKVVSVAADARTLQVTNRPEAVAGARVDGPPPDHKGRRVGPPLNGGAALPLRALKAGGLLSTRVVKVVDNGLVVALNLQGGGQGSKPLLGVVEQGHLAAHTRKEHWQAMYSVGDVLPQARLLTVDYASRAFTLSLRPHLLTLRGPARLPPPGLVVDNAVVLRVDPKEGLLVGVPASVMAAVGEEEEETKEDSASSKKKKLKGIEAAAAAGNGMRVGVWVPLARCASAASRGADEASHLVAREGGENARLAKEKAWKLDKVFSLGDEVRIRVVAANLLEGLAVATAVPEEIDAVVLSSQELAPGQVHKGSILAAEGFGVLVGLSGAAASATSHGEAKALVTVLHLADAEVTDPKKRFRVGAKVSCRLLTVDKGGRKVHATMKKALVTDPTPPLMAYEELLEAPDQGHGRAATGFVSRVTAGGLTVTFFGNVYGVVASRTLLAQGVDDVHSAYAPGQVVKCRVLKCTSSKAPKNGSGSALAAKPHLSLALDLPGADLNALGLGQKSSTASTSTTSSASQPPMGSLVSGVVLKRSGPSPAQDGKKGSGKPGVLALALDAPYEHCTAELPWPHCGDFGALAAATVAISTEKAPSEAGGSSFGLGARLEGLLVLSNSKRKVVSLSAKPLLLRAAAAASEAASEGTLALPSTFNGAEKKSVICGAVRGIEPFGAFVECSGGLCALVPRAHGGDTLVAGSAVCAAVRHVDDDKQRLVLSTRALGNEPCRASLAVARAKKGPWTYVQQMLMERYRFGASHAAAAAAGGGSLGASAGALPDLKRYPTGTTTDGTVTSKLADGSLLLLADDGVTVMLAPALPGGGTSRGIMHAGDAGSDVAVGAVVKCRVLDVAFSAKERKHAPAYDAATAIGLSESSSALLSDASNKKPGSGGGHLVVTCSPSLVKAGRTKRRKAAAQALLLDKSDVSDSNQVDDVARATSLSNGITTVKARVLLVEPTWGYAVVSVKDPSSSSTSGSSEESFDDALTAYLMLADYHCPAAAVAAVVAATEEEEEEEKGAPAKKSKGSKASSSAAAAAAEPPVLSAWTAAVTPGAEIDCSVLSAPMRAAWLSGGSDVTPGKEPWFPQQHMLVLARADDFNAATQPLKTTSKATKNASTSVAKSPEELTEEKAAAKARAKAEKAAARAAAMAAGAAASSDGPGGVVSGRVDWLTCPPHGGKRYPATVTDVRPEGVVVVLGSEAPSSEAASALVRGFVNVLDVVTTPEEARAWAKGKPKLNGSKVKVGTSLSVWALSVDLPRQRLELSVTTAPQAHEDDATSNKKKAKEVLCKVLGGPEVEGASSLALPTPAALRASPALMVALPGRRTGLVCATELAEPSAWTSLQVHPTTGSVVVAPSSAAAGDASIAPGTFRTCVILGAANNMQPGQDNSGKSSAKKGKGAKAEVLSVSFRPSRLTEAKASNENNDENGSDDSEDDDEEEKSAGLPPVGAVVKGFVASTGAGKGCFVRLRHDVVGRVLLKDLADKFVQDPSAEFPPGKLVAAKVLSVNAASNLVNLSLRPSAVMGDKKKAAVMGLEPGTYHKGVVVRVEKFGVFVQIKGGAFSGVQGLCHLSEAADMFIADLGAVYEAGDLVRCKVLRVNKEKGTVSLGLKASYFEGVPETDSEDEEEGSDDEEESDEEDEGAAMDEDDDDDDDDEEEGGRVLEAMSASEDEAESDDENFGAKLQKQLKGGDYDDEEEEDDDEDDEEDDEEESDDDDDDDDDEESSAKAAPRASSTSVVASNGFEWGDFSVPAALYSTAGGFDDRSDDDDDNGMGNASDSDDDEDGGGSGGKKRKRSQSAKQKQKAREADEESVRKAERAAAQKARNGPSGGGWDDAALASWTADDFERELLATPNDSGLWIQYMASKLKVLDVDTCRAIARRALKTILFREEDEKRNVWVALINLEHGFGTKQSLNAVITEACAASHPKKIRLRVAAMLEEGALRQGAADDALAEAEAAYAVAAKKHKTSKQVWSAYVRFALRANGQALPGSSSNSTSNVSDPAMLVAKALKCTQPHKHVFICSRFAQDEYQFGSVERGRTVFEELLGRHGTKRLDLWNVYLDQEAKAGQTSHARSLYQRLVSLKISSRAIKGVFKKWLAFEKAHGTAKEQAAVRDRAREYVQSELQKGEN